jgi:hypothetical protein
MRRTTIMLPDRLRVRAMEHARSAGISLGELIREALAARLDSPSAARQRDPFFADEAVFRGSGPSDGSENHDRYLYGEKP